MKLISHPSPANGQSHKPVYLFYKGWDIQLHRDGYAIYIDDLGGADRLPNIEAAKAVIDRIEA